LRCRHCQAALSDRFLDLGFAPPSNAYLSNADLSRPERYYPLRTWVCRECWLVQTEDFAAANELFDASYAYFSSTSSSWLSHAKRYCDDIAKRLGLGRDSFVIEIASNDGYLLKNFVAAGVPCLGIEPTESTASAAAALGVPVLKEFFDELLGVRLASDGRQADLIIGNNVYAHVPKINDFTSGLKAALKPGGTISLEFPHILRLIENAQFDTIYHEHFSYFSLYTVARIFAAHGLKVVDAEELQTHGGSLRVYGAHENDPRRRTSRVTEILNVESASGLCSISAYAGVQSVAEKTKDDLLDFLIAMKRERKKVVGYGAAAKGNTLLNYAGVKPDLLPVICDAAPSKQGKFMPGSHIPIAPSSELSALQADFVLILPWNICSEVMAMFPSVRASGARFVVAIPRLRFL
jgi:SAM-dependent methyltransferase